MGHIWTIRDISGRSGTPAAIRIRMQPSRIHLSLSENEKAPDIASEALGLKISAQHNSNNGL